MKYVKGQQLHKAEVIVEDGVAKVLWPDWVVRCILNRKIKDSDERKDFVYANKKVPGVNGEQKGEEYIWDHQRVTDTQRRKVEQGGEFEELFTTRTKALKALRKKTNASDMDPEDKKLAMAAIRTALQRQERRNKLQK